MNDLTWKWECRVPKIMWTFFLRFLQWAQNTPPNSFELKFCAMFTHNVTFWCCSWVHLTKTNWLVVGDKIKIYLRNFGFQIFKQKSSWVPYIRRCKMEWHPKMVVTIIPWLKYILVVFKIKSKVFKWHYLCWTWFWRLDPRVYIRSLPSPLSS